jgi:D-glycero-D-manno-heptose 1,7-bisphosphate phosphatase
MRLVILDRDGVINFDSDDYIKSPEEYIPIPGSLEAIARLNRAGYTVAVASNQSGIARGYFSLDTLNAMHDKLHALLSKKGGKIDGIFFCPHLPSDDCHCRKPKPGLLEQISEHFHTPLEGVPFIGDSAADIKAARSVGARAMLVKTGKGERTLQLAQNEPELLQGVPVFEDLAAAVDALLKS